jgi:hypothetical protein
LRRFAAQSGLTPVELRMVEKKPSYARSSPLLFFPMMFYERLVNSSEMFAVPRAAIFGVVRKPM